MRSPSGSTPPSVSETVFGRGIELKSPDQIAVMRRAGLVVAHALDAVQEAAAPGVTTVRLNEIAAAVIADHGATSNFLGYGAWGDVPGFPGVICTSVNEEVVHGIPGGRVLAEGDVVSIDCGAIVDGWHGDAARTFGIGALDPADARLVETTEQALWMGIAAGGLGRRIGDIGHAISSFVEETADAQDVQYGIADGYTGHGIGTEMHQAPDVPNTGKPGRGPKITEGLVIAIEPMVSRGSDETRTLDDEWTVVSADGSRAAHWEHTVTWTSRGAWVLTAHDGGRARLAELGLAYGGDDAR